MASKRAKLTVMEGNAAEPAVGAAPAPGRGEPTVLVVEDDDAERDALGALLSTAGYRVIAAASGEEAVELAEALSPDALLLDLVLPGISGLEAIRLLRGHPATAQTPVIATTASWLGERRDVLATAGFNGALRKPFTGRQLFDELARALSPAIPAIPAEPVQRAAS